MKEIFCERTSDLTVFFSRKEALKFKGDPHYTPVLQIDTGGRVFHFMQSDSDGNIDVTEPRYLSYPHYWVRIGRQAREDLLRLGRCGTRYGLSSKINLIIDEELSQPLP